VITDVEGIYLNLHDCIFKTCFSYFPISIIINIILNADEETGGYVSYQCVLPMLVHGSGYVQMQMISNSKAEKLVFTLSKYLNFVIVKILS
jgi:hypothetical protein